MLRLLDTNRFGWDRKAKAVKYIRYEISQQMNWWVDFPVVEQVANQVQDTVELVRFFWTIHDEIRAITDA